MADINGLEKRRASLSALVPQKVLFGGNIQHINIVVMGDATVAFKLNENITDVNDDTSNYLDSYVSQIELYDRNNISSISFISDKDVNIQWDWR